MLIPAPTELTEFVYILFHNKLPHLAFSAPRLLASRGICSLGPYPAPLIK